MLNSKNLTGILKCIHCNSQHLNFSTEGNELICANCENKYPVMDNVPVLLPEDETNSEIKSKIHEQSGTSFKYIDHYQKDAYTSDYFEKRDSGTEHGERRVREYISAEISGKKGIILDVGCGKGWVAELFCPLGYEVISMDISLRNTSRALKMYPFKNHHAVVADAFNPPYRNDSFDFIIASEIIEHVYDPEIFIKNLFSTLKPGGKLIVTTPYKEKIQYSLCIHCNKPTPVHAHLHSFDEKILKSLFWDKNTVKWNYKVFANKILIHLRTHTILKFLNFKSWKIIDSLSNLLYYAPSRILVTWEKKLQ